MHTSSEEIFTQENLLKFDRDSENLWHLNHDLYPPSPFLCKQRETPLQTGAIKETGLLLPPAPWGIFPETAKHQYFSYCPQLSFADTKFQVSTVQRFPSSLQSPLRITLDTALLRIWSPNLVRGSTVEDAEQETWNYCPFSTECPAPIRSVTHWKAHHSQLAIHSWEVFCLSKQGSVLISKGSESTSNKVWSWNLYRLSQK